MAERGERGIDRFHAHSDGPTDKMQRAIAQQRAGQQPGLAKNLESVADADNRDAGLGHVGHRRHDRRMPGHCAAAQIVAVGEPAGNHHRTEAVEGGFPVPDVFRLIPAVVAQGADAVLVAIRPGELDDREARLAPAGQRGEG